MDKTIKTPDWSKAPQSGWILAVPEDGQTVFERFTREDSGVRFPGMERLNGKLIRRCHCFDENSEYRYLCVGDSMRVIETVCDAKQEADMDPDLLYEDDLILSAQYAPGEEIRKLRVINRYRYTECNTLTVEDYRLGGVYSDRKGGCL